MRRLLLLLPLAAACAPAYRMPAFEPEPRWGERSAWMPPDAFASTMPKGFRLRRDTDETRQLTRLAVITHKGVYTGWVQRPQISFYVQDAWPRREGTPATVALLFRTIEPQAVTANRLMLGCGATVDTLPVTPRSQLERHGARTHFLTYHLPVEAVARFAACETGTMEVGQVRARFEAKHFTALQAFLRATGG